MRRRLGENVIALLLTQRGGRSPKAAAAWLAVLLATIVAPFGTTFFGEHPFTARSLGHTQRSLNQALMQTFCGRVGPDSDVSALNVFGAVMADPRLQGRPLLNTIILRAGSLDAYCRDPSPDFQNNENSLMLLMRASLWLNPRLTPFGLGKWFGGLRLLMVAVAVYVALLCGAPVILTAAALAAICSVLRAMDPFYLYAFFIPVLVLMAALYVAAHRRIRVARTPVLLAVCAGLGFLSGFGVNLRSSFLPTFVLLCAVFLWSLRYTPAPPPGRAVLGFACASFLFGFMGFNWAFIEPLERAQTMNVNYSYHPVAHPLVLALAVPSESALTKREGIVWSDRAGEVLARRMIPEAEYLGPLYEKALFLYYLKLWLLYPREMLDIYRSKLAVVGTGAFGGPYEESEKLTVTRAISRFGRVRRGEVLVGSVLIVIAVSAWVFARTRSPLALLLMLLGVPALMILLEGVAIYPLFWLSYHSYLLFFLALMQLIGVQIVVEAVAAKTGGLYPAETALRSPSR